MKTLTQRNEVLILRSFFYELKNHKFSISVYEEDEIFKIYSFETILEIHDFVKGITFHVSRGNYRGYATFSFGNTELGIFCMNSKSDSLKPFIVNTLAVIANLAQKKHLMYELEQRIKIKESARLNEWAIIQETIDHLIRNGFSVKNTDGSKLDLRILCKLHERSHDKQFNGTKKESICLKVLSADCQDDYIQFTAGKGLNVISGYSRNLTFQVNFIRCRAN